MDFENRNVNFKDDYIILVISDDEHIKKLAAATTSSCVELIVHLHILL